MFKKFKCLDLSEEKYNEIASAIDNQGFYYALTEGYINPSDILTNIQDIDRLEKAIITVQKFEHSCPSY